MRLVPSSIDKSFLKRHWSTASLSWSVMVLSIMFDSCAESSLSWESLPQLRFNLPHTGVSKGTAVITLKLHTLSFLFKRRFILQHFVSKMAAVLNVYFSSSAFCSLFVLSNRYDWCLCHYKLSVWFCPGRVLQMLCPESNLKHSKWKVSILEVSTVLETGHCSAAEVLHSAAHCSYRNLSLSQKGSKLFHNRKDFSKQGPSSFW